MNPYLDENGKPRLCSSYCVYMDILGFSEHIITSFNNSKGQIALDHFYEVFTKRLNSIFNHDFEGKYCHWNFKVFTDNIVLGYAFDSWHAEPELCSVFEKVGLYQLSMALENFFIRGAITVGDLFLDENTVFGQTLLEAYELESKHACNPRVILSEDVVKYLRRHIGFYGNPRHAPQTREVLLDADGEIFVHYLYLLIDQASYNPYLNAEDLANHKEIVIRNIETYRSTPKIWEKYQWLANYHNFFCDQCRRYENYNDDLVINKKILETKPIKFASVVQNETTK